MYIGVNSSSEKLWTENTATSGKLINAVYAVYVNVYILCTSRSDQLEYNFLFVGLGGWGVRGSEWKRGFTFCEWGNGMSITIFVR